MDAPTIAAFGALLAGIGSVLSSLMGLRIHKKRAIDECDKRVRELSKAFRAGMGMRRKDDVDDEGLREREERWSHLP